MNDILIEIDLNAFDNESVNNMKKNEIIKTKYKIGKKFADDCFYYDNKNIICLFEGVILNKAFILDKYKEDNFVNMLTTNICKENYKIINELRGNFAFIYIDLNIRKIVVGTDHMGNYPLFYRRDSGKLFFSNKVKMIIDSCTENGIGNQLDLVGAYSMLTYAYMIQDFTIERNTKRLLPGNIAKYNNKKIQLIKYHEINIKFEKISENDAIENLDELFLKALKLQSNKNAEYGYNNYSALSAGLDSRMTIFGLKRIKANGLICYTYSESLEEDCMVPMQIARDLKLQWIYRNLDSGRDLIEIDDAIKISDGIQYYSWSSQLNNFMKLINTDKVGIVHTGIIGDVVVSSFIKSDNDLTKKYSIGDGAYSTKLISRLEELLVLDETSYEEGMLYNRGLNGANQGYQTTFNVYSCSMSPFMNIDFFDYCMKLPIDYRYRHYIYYKWVSTKYPKSTEYLHNGIKISDSRLIKLNGKTYPILSLPSFVKTKVFNIVSKNHSMNPFDKWYQNDKHIQEYMSKYFFENIDYVKNKRLKADISFLYETGTTLEKTMALSLLGNINLMCLKN